MDNLKKQIPEEAKEILEIIESHQYQAYFVGGCVRDSLLNKAITDIDIATSATPEEIMALFPTVIPIGLEHGTVLVRHGQVSYEITTFRTESTYSNQRHPDEVSFVTNIQEDLARRDFTINAMALDYKDQLTDPFCGQIDLDRKMIRTVGLPKERFQEDALRIIRALRFSSQLGFTIEQDTLVQMKQLNHTLDNISVERITQEMDKFFQGNAIQTGMNYLRETEIISHLPIMKELPELMNHTPVNMTPFQRFGEVVAFFYLIDQTYSIAAWAKAWKCSNNEKKIATHLVENIERWQREGLSNWLIYQLGETAFSMFIHLIGDLYNHTLDLKDLKIQKSELPIQASEELCIDGKSLQSHFTQKKPGRWIGQMLQEVEYLVVIGKLNNNLTDVKEWIQCHPPGSD